MPIGDVTMEGERLITNWRNTKIRLERAKDELDRAQEDLNRMANELGAWLCPEDTKVGENIAVWYGDSLIQATKLAGSHTVVLRKRGRSLVDVP